MSLHQRDERHLLVSPTGKVLTEGGSYDLQPGIVAVASKDRHKVTKRGLAILSDFNGIDKKREKLTILGKRKSSTGRFGSNKSGRTIDFTLSDIKRAFVSHPKVSEPKVDYFRIGWDGINDNTSLKFHKGQTFSLEITFHGIAVTFFQESNCYTAKAALYIPDEDAHDPCSETTGNCEPEDCREHTLRLVRTFQDMDLPLGRKFSELFDIYPIFKTPKQNTNIVEYKQYVLGGCGFSGNAHENEVYAQYPGAKITKDSFTNEYLIFQEADKEAPKPFTSSFKTVVRGCEDCPEGFEKVEGGFVYAVALEDDGEDRKDVVETLTGAKAGTAKKTGQNYGVGNYIVVTEAILTAEELKTFVDANPTATVLTSGIEVQDFCQKEDCKVEFEWKEKGTFKATKAKYRILVPDDCKGARLEEMQSLHKDLEIRLVESANCVSVYETEVVTTHDFDKGCNPEIVESIFNSEAPRSRVFNRYWYPVVEADEAKGVACGIEIKAKPFVINAENCLIDELPFVVTSTRISNIHGGQIAHESLFTIGDASNVWAVTQLERAQDMDNLGGNLRGLEEKGLFYFENDTVVNGPVGRLMSGTQSKLEGLVQYSDVAISVEKWVPSGMNDRSLTPITYHVLIPYGKSEQIEELFSKLAGAAGVPFEVL